MRQEVEAQEAKDYEKLKKQKFVPRNSYQHKYEHLIGTEEDFQVAKKAEVKSHRSFGMVSAESKKDRRTVEQVQAEIRAKKRAAATHILGNEHVESNHTESENQGTSLVNLSKKST